MKYTVFVLFLVSASLSAFADLPLRPMSSQMVQDPDFGLLLATTARQGIGEGLIFEWATEIVGPWNYLASISDADQEYDWTVYLPERLYPAKAFVRARGVSPDESLPVPPSPSSHIIPATDMVSPGVKIHGIKR